MLSTHRFKRFNILLLAVATFAMAGCCRPGSPDRFECMNRPVYAFNKAADRVAFKPAARVYEALVPRPLKTMVGHFFQNLSELPSAGNDLLQGNLSGMRTDLSRFLINTTWGVGGLFDLASTGGSKARKQDFGLTLATWGYKDSSYLVLPFFGPSTVRDGLGRIGTYSMGVTSHLHSVRLRNELLALNYLNIRASLLKTDSALNDAVDEYIFVREAYLQHRQAEIEGKEYTTASTSFIPLDGPPE
ncbi:MAG: VacJ family lipoprotein [Gammaproteobacteria bacterium]|nr:VacJ family lipoprotein [Gammaproteobacteria bacterium]MBP9729507.1 VacJ family lipoprotein [Gammaproteobacteria bacterium]